MDFENMSIQYFIKVCRAARDAENAQELPEFITCLNEICTLSIDHYVRVYGKDAALARIEETMETLHPIGAPDVNIKR